MKTLKILFLSVFLIFLVNTASAVVVYGEWDSNQEQSISIEDGDSVDFSAFFGTIATPMTISIKFYDSGNNLIHTFKDTGVSQNSFAQTYTVNQDIYSRPGDYEVRISGSDSYGDMSTTLYLDVINYAPVITSIPVLEVDEKNPYEYQVVATDPDNHVLTYSLEGPDWLSINSQIGLITGTAPDVIHDTNFDVEVVVSDGIDTETQSYTLTVIWIPNPSLLQTLALFEDVKVDYSATLSELDSAVLNIYYKAPGSSDYDPDPIATRDIGPSYDELFNFYEIHQKTKGDYQFVLEAVGYDLSITDYIHIEDYPPEVDLGSISADFNEEATIEITLPAPTDKNPEDEPVPYLSPNPLDDKTTAEVNGNILTITGNKNAIGNYQVELEFGQGVTGTEILSGEIYDLIDISGVLENNEDDTGTQGVVRIYDSDQAPLEINQIYEGSIIDADLGKIETDSEGDFSFQLNERASDLDEIILQARIGTANNDQGYVRTITLDGDDNSDVLIRAVPYAPYEDDPIIFRQFMYELAGSPPNTRFDFDGEYLGGLFGFENYTGLLGIEILSENPFGAEYGTFTTEEQINIKNKILNSTDISGIIGNYSIDEEQVYTLNESQVGHYGLYNTSVGELAGNEKVLAHPGWIIVTPYSNMGYNGLADTRTAGTLVYGGTVYLYPSIGLGFISNHTISHEFGHIFIGGHPISMPPNQSVMIKGSGVYLQTTGPADKKAGELIYEETFMIFPPLKFPSVDFVYNILELEFYGESQISGIFNEYYFEPEDDENDFTRNQKPHRDDIIDSDIDFSTDNADIPYDDTIYLQSNTEKKNILISLSDIIRQVVSFIKSVFSI